jgi:hypothetical protein
MDDFHKDVQLSLFVLCKHDSRYAQRLRTYRKSRGLTYMKDAEFSVTGGCPLAHCTVLLRKKRGGGAFISFLEKDHLRRTKDLNLGKFLLGVTLKAVAPFCDPDADLTLEAADNGSGRLVAYYRKLGMESKAGTERSENGKPFISPMSAKLLEVLALCSRPSASAVRTSTGAVAEEGQRDLAFREKVPSSEKQRRQASADDHVLESVKRKRTLEPCAICMETLPLEVSALPERTLQCGHRFHTACIQEWLDKAASCPLCKTPVVAPSRSLPTPCRTPRRMV